MQLEGRTLSDGAHLESDLCIVGAGPAGLSLAAQFGGGRTSVVVLESGSWKEEPAPQLLNRGRVEGDPYAGLEATRRRQIGGSTWLWNTPLAATEGAKFVPLDPLDFRGEGGRPPWPFQFQDLEPYYRRAQAVAGLGPLQYEASAWKLPPLPIPADHPTFASRVYQFGLRDTFSRTLPAMLRRDPHILLCHGATATRLRWNGRAVVAVEATTASGNRITVGTRRLVLAGGGIESTRILMVETDAGRLEDESGWLGRGFMEHPRDFSMTIATTSRAVFERLEFFDAHRIDGVPVCGRIALQESAIVDQDLLNASVTFLPIGRPRRQVHWRIQAMARRIGWNLCWPPGYGWSGLRSSARDFDGFQLLINLEEFPHPDNRLILDAERDPLGIPRVRLVRRWRQADQDRLARLRARLAGTLEEIGLAPVGLGPAVTPDPNGHHHMGTTRMAADSKRGVTDANGRVFGTDNLFVLGPSLFPTGGYANPTLTIIALALRLADHLRSNT